MRLPYVTCDERQVPIRMRKPGSETNLMAGKLGEIRLIHLFRTFVVLACLYGLVPACPIVVRADDATDKFNLGVGMYKDGRWKLAAKTFQEYLKSHPNHAKAPLGRLYQGLALVNLGQYQEARTLLRVFVKNNPQSRYLPDALYRVAECSYLLDELKPAETEFQTFLQKYPKHDFAEWALPYLGDAQLRLSKFQPAADSFKKSLDLFPEGRMAEDAKFGLARSLKSLKKPSEAVTLYKELAANRSSARAPRAQLELGNLYFDAENYAEAANAYDDLERSFPQSDLVSLARLDAGYAYHQIGEYRKAIAKLQLAAKDEQHKLTADYWRGICHRKLGEYAEAGAALKEAFEAEPKGKLAESTLYQWARSELELGRHDSARELFLKLLDGWPKGDLADDALHFAAEAALTGGQLEEADKLVARFNREYPQSSLRMHHQLLAGRLLDAKGGDANCKQAAAIFQKVLDESEIARTQSWARFYLARTWQKLDDHKRVLEAVGPLAEELMKEGASAELADALAIQGISFSALKQHEDASKAMTQYLKLSPDGGHADEALSTLAIAQAHQNNKAASQSHLAQLTKKSPQSPLLAETLYRVAEIAYEAKDWQWAASLFTPLVALGAGSPYHAEGLAGLAWCQQEQKQFREAAATFARVVKEHPDDKDLAPEAAYMQGKALQDAGELAPAATAYTAAFRKFAPEGQSPAGAEQHLPASYAYRAGLQAARVLGMIEGKAKEADAAYAELNERFPKPKDLDKLLDEWAVLNYQAANYERADEIFRRLVADTPGSDLADNARLSLAESELLAGKVDSARKTFLELESSPKSDQRVQQVALSHLVGIAVERRQWKEVQETSGRLISRFPDSEHRWQAEFYRGEAQLQQGDVAAAQKTMLKLKAEIDNEQVGKADWFPRVWVLLAETYLRGKQYDDVLRAADEFRAWNPRSKWLYQVDEILGRSLKNQAKFDQARAAFARAIAGPGAHRTETAAKSQFMIAETYLMQNDHENALKEYLKVYYLYKYPEWQAPALYQAAVCDEKLNQWNDAVRAYEDVLKDFPESEFAAKAKKNLPNARQKAAR